MTNNEKTRKSMKDKGAYRCPQQQATPHLAVAPIGTREKINQCWKTRPMPSYGFLLFFIVLHCFPYCPLHLPLTSDFFQRSFSNGSRGFPPMGSWVPWMSHWTDINESQNWNLNLNSSRRPLGSTWYKVQPCQYGVASHPNHSSGFFWHLSLCLLLVASQMINISWFWQQVLSRDVFLSGRDSHQCCQAYQLHSRQPLSWIRLLPTIVWPTTHLAAPLCPTAHHSASPLLLQSVWVTCSVMVTFLLLSDCEVRPKWSCHCRPLDIRRETFKTRRTFFGYSSKFFNICRAIFEHSSKKHSHCNYTWKQLINSS